MEISLLKPRELSLRISQKRLARYSPTRCAGDFCQSQAGKNEEESFGHDGRSSTTTSSGGLGASASDKALLPSTDIANPGAEHSSLRRKGDFKQGEHYSAGQESMRNREEEIVGKRKHASAVETPRTVPFRLVSFNVGDSITCGVILLLLENQGIEGRQSCALHPKWAFRYTMQPPPSPAKHPLCCCSRMFV